MPTINVVGGIRLLGGSVSMPFVNIPPSWTTASGDLGSVKEFDTVTSGGFAIAAIDVDGLPVTPVVYDIVAGALPTGATLDATTGVITGPAVAVAGDQIFNFTARVSDGQDQVTRAFSITVKENLAPTWTTPVGTLGSRHEAETITSGGFTVTATDPDSGPSAISYSVFSGTLPTGASLNSSTGDITGPVVIIASDTTYNFTIDASDGDKTTNRAFSITVDNNTVPVWQTSNASPLATVDEGTVVNVSVNATDADGLPLALTYTVAVGSLPAGLSLNPSTGAITGTATTATSNFFTIEANDGLDGAQRQFQIIVNSVLATVSFTASAATGVNLTTYTFAAQALGTPAADRKIVVGVSALGASNGPKSISSMTIGGVAATNLIAVQNSVEDKYITELWQAAVPTGATGDVVITFNASMNSVGIGVYAAFGATASAHATAFDSDNSAPMTATINVPANGILIGASGDNVSGFTWTNLTEKYDSAIELGESHTGASDQFATLQTGLLITVTSGGNRKRLALVSFGP